MKILFSAAKKQSKEPSLRKKLRECKTKEERVALKLIYKENRKREENT